jgi:2-methylisocitrate lyase-like PEP mutase family enzyme
VSASVSQNQSPNNVLKALVARRQAVIIPGAPNARAARLIEDIGFEAIYVTGAGVTNMFLGTPDLGLITLAELADHVAAMRDVVSLPLIVDADTGFGNAINVTRTVKVLERAGASAIQIEDQVFPKKCGHFAGKDVIDTGEMVQKIRAAVDSRRDGEFQIIARTDARQILGFEAALDRAEAFIEAGADITFVEAPESAEELAAIPARLGVPQLANMVFGGNTPLLEQAELAAMGFSVVLYANAALQSAIHGMQTALGALRRDGSLAAVGNLLASFDERQRVVGKPLYDALEEKYGNGEARP